MLTPAELFLRRRVKKEIRKRMRAVRQAIPKEAHHTHSKTVAESVCALDFFENATTVAAFVPIHEEVDITLLFETIWSTGKSLALPRMDADANAIVFHQHTAEATLETGAFGVLEPAASTPQIPKEAIDLILVPALAVDQQGYRIGYGKGFYDQLLPTLPNAIRVAVAFDFQLIPEAPFEPEDVPVDHIVSEKSTLEADKENPFGPLARQL